MQYILPIIAILFFTNCKNISDTKPERHIQFDWLQGEWTRTNEKEGRVNFENWQKVSDSTYTGHAYTLEGRDTVWQEWTQLSPIDGKWYFQARMKDEANTTNFQLTTLTDTSFICENPDNEFPKIIKYWKNKNGIHAEISDGEMIIPFDFVSVHE